MTDQQLTFVDIAEYLERPDAPEHARHRRGLLQDSYARRRADLLHAGIDTLRNDPGLIEQSRDADALEEQTLRDSLRAQLLESEQVLAKTEPARTPWWQRWLQPAIPVWGAAVGMVTVAALTVILTVNWHAESTQIASFRDDTSLHVTSDSLPGIGFFTGSRTEVRSFDEVQIDVLDERIRLLWPAIEDVAQYRVQLFVITGEQRQELANGVTVANEFTFPVVSLETHRRYEWIISGQFNDERRFETRGGFVLQ